MTEIRFIVRKAKQPTGNQKYAVVEQTLYDSGQSRDGDEVAHAATESAAQKLADDRNKSI